MATTKTAKQMRTESMSRPERDLYVDEIRKQEIKVELIGKVVLELLEGKKMDEIIEKMGRCFGPDFAKRWVPQVCTLINQAGKQTEC